MLRGIISQFKRRQGQKRRRDEYKAVWNSVSGTEDEAKGAVSGYTDENIYTATALDGREVLLRTVGISKDDVVLEIGAGVGRMGAVLAPICREWIGVDVSENMVRHMERRLAKFGNVRTLTSSGYDLSNIASESVNVVYCHVVFMHLQEWDRYNYIREGFRVLKPGGRMYVDNVNLLSDSGWAFFEKHTQISPAERPPNISVTSTPQEQEAYFKRAGYLNIKQESYQDWIRTWGTKP